MFNFRGLEKETLRVFSDGRLALDPHPHNFGSALTHPFITTDFSEGLLELITEPFQSWEQVEAQLHEMNQWIYHHLPEGQLLWPGSMPPLLPNLDCIPIAHYGNSNLGQMKHIYREGLVHRYGKAMQMIAGLHYNFSFSANTWKSWFGYEPTQSEISAAYLRLIRNFYEHYWLLPYLFGASPLVMETSLNGRNFPSYLEHFSDQTGYAPYATSLRNSDLGYHNAGQDQLDISYQSVESYADSLLKATQIKDPRFEQIGAKKNGHYLQLSDAILQIENEYYTPIRPKQIYQFPERPAVALKNRGIAYVEVRVLDLNPFEPLGINATQAYFMDVFLFFCLRQKTEVWSLTKCQSCRERFYKVVMQGRDPSLTLPVQEAELPFKQVADLLFESLIECAAFMDASLAPPVYEAAVRKEYQKVLDVSLTPSHQALQAARTHGGYQGLMLYLAKEHRAFYLKDRMVPNREAFWQQQTQASWQATTKLEQSASPDFDEFLRLYFRA